MSKEQNMKNKMLKGTIILTVAGVITRVIGFLYRIFWPILLGDTKLGIYQMIFPIYGIALLYMPPWSADCCFSIGCRSPFKKFKTCIKVWNFLFALLFDFIIRSLIYFFRLDKYSFAVCKRNGTIVKNTLGYISFLWNYKYYQWVFLWKTSCESTVHHTNY